MLANIGQVVLVNLSLVFMVVCIGVSLFMYKYNSRINNTIKGLEKTLNTKVDTAFSREYMVDMVAPKDGVDDLSKYSKLNLDIVGDEYSKGYDCIFCTYKKDDKEGIVPVHLHKKSAEFFVGIRGTFVLDIDGERHLITSKNSTLVPAKTNHSLYFKEDCEFLIIAKPPLFSKKSMIYEKLRESFKR